MGVRGGMHGRLYRCWVDACMLGGFIRAASLSPHHTHIAPPFLPPQVGLRAAMGAGMRCIITPTTSTGWSVVTQYQSHSSLFQSLTAPPTTPPLRLLTAASANFLLEGATAVVPVMMGAGYRVRGCWEGGAIMLWVGCVTGQLTVERGWWP